MAALWQVKTPATSTGTKQPLWQRLRVWRPVVARLVGICILIMLAYWLWYHRQELGHIWTDVSLLVLAACVGLLSVGALLATLSFTMLVRCIGYRFTYSDGYHSMNLAQVAAMVPGKIWGFAGLASLLWARGLSKQDSVLVICLHSVLMLSGALVVGLAALLPLLGWPCLLVCVLPIGLLIGGRSWCEWLRQRLFHGSSALPATSQMLGIFTLGVASWLAVAAGFALFTQSVSTTWVVPFWLTASAFTAGYVGGFISLIAPAGLGVREGIIALILGPRLGTETALGLAIMFRVVHMAVLWLQILVTWGMLCYGSWRDGRTIR